MQEPTWESPTSYKGPRQKHIPKRALIAKLTGYDSPGGVAGALIIVGDSRLRTKIKITPDRLPFLFDTGWRLWMGGVDDDDAGPNGRRFRVSNAIPGVTLAVGQAFPQDAGLEGYSREFTTAIDNVEVALTIPAYVAPTVRTFAADAGDTLFPTAWSVANANFTQADVGLIFEPELDAPNEAFNIQATITEVVSPTFAYVSRIGGDVFDIPPVGNFHIKTPGPIGQIYVSARFQPDGQRLPPDEWEEVKRLTQIQGITKIVR